MRITTSSKVMIELTTAQALELRNELLSTCSMGEDDMLNELLLSLEAKFPRNHYAVIKLVGEIPHKVDRICHRVIRLVDCSLFGQVCNYPYTKDFKKRYCEKCSYYLRWRAEIEGFENVC